MELVHGRECGACTVCCVVLNIDSPEFQKLPGAPCQHLKKSGAGCSIHATVFPACRSYHCGWRYIAGLGEEWRPDKSGVLIDFQIDGLPPHYKKRPGVRLTIVGPKETAFHAAFLNHIAHLIADDVPVIFAMPGPPGQFPASVFLNDALKDAARARDFIRIKDFFAMLLNELKKHSFNPVVHRHGANA